MPEDERTKTKGEVYANAVETGTVHKVTNTRGSKGGHQSTDAGDGHKKHDQR